MERDNTYKDLLKTNADGSYVKRGDRIEIDATKLTDGTINPYDFSKWLYDNSKLLTDMNQTKTGQATGSLEWTGLDLGYYMIKSTAGTIVSLDTNDKNTTVHEKNPAQTDLAFTKNVKGGTAADYAKTTYANIGEEVEFKITFNVHEYANNEYVLTDTLPGGMDYVNGSFKVEGLEGLTGKDLYSSDTFAANNKELKVTFPLTTIQELAKTVRDDDTITSKTVTVTYKAKLNKSALMSNNTEVKLNKNTAALKYDTADTAKVTAEASVKTTEFNILKYASTGETGNQTESGLAGAKFKIYTKESGGNPLILTTDIGSNIYYYNGQDQDTTGGTEITTPEDGQFTIKGLKTGEYYIEETQAPEGFNSLESRVKLTIADGTTVDYSSDDGAVEGNTLKILNQGGTKLPSTGGMGRNLIYTVGAVVFFGALILLISRNKNKNKES
ncbi:SpaA isopeptide-forming pilin-related protein [Peptoniphilus sp.]|uniref:SpaA isopeptide-forming pilin-related protein n=1 Tax=Peptoniphilus sp. TaxID=1971214 RepID=UPI003D9362AA